MTPSKIVSVNHSIGFLKAASCWSSYNTTICDGVFDLLHVGHIDHFKQAKALSDHLLVLVAKDSHVKKGPGRPIFPESERAELVAAIESVNAVCLVDQDDVIRIIKEGKPNFLAKGEDYASQDDPILLGVKEILESYGGKLVFTTGKPHSSSTIANQNGLVLPEIENYLSKFCEKYSSEDVLGWLDKCRDLKPVVIGEAIEDIYIFCKPEGKSAKDSMITFSSIGRKEVYAGGSLAVFDHLKELCLETKCKSNLFYSSPRVVKTRYIEDFFNQKLFAYDSVSPEMSDWGHGLNADLLKEWNPFLVVADFGHGLIDQELAGTLARRTDFLALTVQTNGLNWGFNLLSKYSTASYVVIDEMELRLATGNKNGDIEYSLESECERLGGPLIGVTLGHRGSLFFDGEEFVSTPAISSKIVDRVGAGDAFLAWTAPLAEVGAPTDIVGFIGAVAAGIQIGSIGNSKPVTLEQVSSWVKSLMAR